MKRECGDCTKCCEGYLSTEVLGNKLHRSKPCPYVSIGKGCSIYAERPEDPCAKFKCSWLVDSELPEWLKPNQINAIIKGDSINNIPFLVVLEAGEILQAKVLSWLVQYAIGKQLNFVWYVDGGVNWIGSAEFHQSLMELDHPIDKFLHSAPKHLLPLVEVK